MKNSLLFRVSSAAVREKAGKPLCACDRNGLYFGALLFKNNE